MVAAFSQDRTSEDPLSLVINGEAEAWLPALEMIVGPRFVHPLRVQTPGELLEVVDAGIVDAAVVDEQAGWDVPVMDLLRMIRRLDAMLPVVVVTARPTDRRWMEKALQLAVFSVMTKPVEFETLLRQIQRIMIRIDHTLRADPREPHEG